MVSLGQPTHVFDYDKIKGAKMKLRESKKGEKVTTLDGKEITLPGGDIVIEDGEGRLIDLCGIMGGENSAVSRDTKNIILFVQTYNKSRIRKTSMTTAQRSVAATYFEKGLDEERVEPTLVYGVELLKQYAHAKVASILYDIYPNPYKPRTISFTLHDVKRIMGVDVTTKEISDILSHLGFTVENKEDNFTATVPSYRKDDIEIKADIVEEIARVWGYHNLPNTIQNTTYVKQPKDIEQLFLLQSKIKLFLKHIGFNESMNYSMVSEDLLKSFELDPQKHLHLSNTISEEIKYFRKSLIPSVVKNMKDNQGKKETLKLFEIAKVYIPREKDLPEEKYKLTLAVNTSFGDLKGALQALLRELHIEDYTIEKSTNPLLSPHVQMKLIKNNDEIGEGGQLKITYQLNNGLKEPLYVAECNFEALIQNYRIMPFYKAPNPYATIKLDLTFQNKSNITYAQIKEAAKKTSSLLYKMEFVSQFENKITLRFYFASREKNITESDAQKELELIKCNI